MRDDDWLRGVFEEWAKSPPREWVVDRFPEFPESTAWPGQYKVYHVQCCWEALTDEELRQELRADALTELLWHFDPEASGQTDLYTWIEEKQRQIVHLKGRVRALTRQLQDTTL